MRMVMVEYVIKAPRIDRNQMKAPRIGRYRRRLFFDHPYEKLKKKTKKEKEKNA